MHKKYLSIAFFCAYTCSYADVLKNSIIDTKGGQKRAVEIRKGQLLESIEKDKKHLAHVIVSNTIVSKTNSVIEIQLEGRTLRAVLDQTFYDPVLKRWIKAKNITANNHMLGFDLKHIPVLSTIKKTGEFETVKIMVDGSHYFFADGVLTHNFWGALARIGTFIGLALATKLIDKSVDKIDDALTIERPF